MPNRNVDDEKTRKQQLRDANGGKGSMPDNGSGSTDGPLTAVPDASTASSDDEMTRH